MKLSWNWLEDWVRLDGLDTGEVADRLTMAGLEVESVDSIGTADDIVIGQIEQINNHPDADKLVLCDVDVDRNGNRQIVCGADNMEVGDRVPVALPGSTPPGVDFGIAEREVRGQTSNGMLCSGQELDLEDQSDGLMILDPEAPIGADVFEHLGLRDTVLELDLTPNRPDCLSHLGAAREISALFNRPLEITERGFEARRWQQGQAELSELASLEVEAAERCPGYLCAAMSGVQVGPSPNWLKSRLHSLGVRSVNNIVDATNFILFDIGQPLHAFDLDKLAGPSIQVRTAKEGERLVGIDHEEYVLDGDDLVIADRDRPIALAGVIGGKDTEVSESTERILIECAYFSPKTVRRSSKRHGLHTDSSHRFERGIDRGALTGNLSRAVEILSDVQSGETHNDGPDLYRGILSEYPQKTRQTHSIHLDRKEPSRLLGEQIPDDQIEQYLTSIGLDVTRDPKHWSVEVPTFRPDLERPADLIEEVARLHGYNRFESTLPTATTGDDLSERLRPDSAPTVVSDAKRRHREQIRRQMLSKGIYEIVRHSFSSQQTAERFCPPESSNGNPVRIANPLVTEQNQLRTSLVPGLVQTLQYNRNQGNKGESFFELGRRYDQDGEYETAGLALAGNRVDHWTNSTEWDFYDAKGLVEDIIHRFDTEAARWSKPESAIEYLHPGVQAILTVDETVMAFVGKLHPEVTGQKQLDDNTFVAEIYLDRLWDLGYNRPVYRAISEYPAVTRDFAFVYDKQKHTYDQLKRAIWKLAERQDAFGNLVESVELFDVYDGKQLPEGKRSVAVSVVYRSKTGTLTDKEVDKADDHLLDWLNSEMGVTIR